ncbi:Ser/Thr phosphatase family superfamily protein [Acanthamoeba castellanii str. Neff]|uniref:Ser/Thr phosphatase family superfamily protein n=1 Tax=Acanthamoeba castellanii (strain ATCC 30010 / Neff) TaxID=1257118 RepID=L8HDM9_ACACF|nr:Ser/Thr phosphatase family superfamily protein [Acanthamoeba castellanii str. Neff]ELR22873.1 Ser/Thr phosphatase family superfamily protein [Acanthamoeba castellanii str. Neff]
MAATQLLLSVLVLAMVVLLLSPTFGDVAQQPPLKFRPDGTFRIVQFTDLHYGEAAEFDVNSARVQTTILKMERPDLVVMTGDSVSGYAWNGKVRPWFPLRWDQLTAPMKSLGIRWAFAVGNHDDQGDFNRTEIVRYDRESSQGLSLTQFGPADVDGVTNYYLPVQSSASQAVAANLWMFDSNDVKCLDTPGWGCVYPSQIEWYRSTARRLQTEQVRQSEKVPGLAFFHIPVPEFMHVWNYHNTSGRLQDTGVCCFSVNTGLYAAWRELDEMVSCHVGHDHNNDFWGVYGGVRLMYGRKSGYGGYGPPPGWLRGARVIEIHENPFKMVTWIRQEDGTVVPESSQPLHSPGTNQTFACCDSLGSTRPSQCHAYETAFRMRHLSL